MGRKPNALILQWFERGPKLADSSNRYPHTCKACGENFPKGRIDSLINHLLKKCVAISASDRLNACLTFNGINEAKQTAAQRVRNYDNRKLMAQKHAEPRDWTALETLAEVSRQIELSEMHDDRYTAQSAANPSSPAPPQDQAKERTDFAEDLTLDHQLHPKFVQHEAVEDQLTTAAFLVANDSDAAEKEARMSSDAKIAESLRSILQNAAGAGQCAAAAAESANMTMAAVATARLNSGLLDPALVDQDADIKTKDDTGENLPESSHLQEVSLEPSTGTSQPWGEITHVPDIADVFYPIAPRPDNVSDPTGVPTDRLARGNHQFEMNDLANGVDPNKPRHSRAKFDATRRREVQEVRKIGACIRCRILRKTCSQGNPCDTCCKVLSPRVWRSGCVRTKFSEQLDMYSACPSIVLAQQTINNWKAAMGSDVHFVVLEAYHFAGQEPKMRLTALRHSKPTSRGSSPATPESLMITAPTASPPQSSAEDQKTSTGAAPGAALSSALVIETETETCPTMIIATDKTDVPACMEAYMRETLPELIRLDASPFMKTTLEHASRVASETRDDLLDMAMKLWGLVEILDRQRQWTICVKPADDQTDGSKDGCVAPSSGTFTAICTQLAAAAERKAAQISKTLLGVMQRKLQDRKTTVDFNMYFASLILLSCVEKTTWTLMSYEQPGCRSSWPLDKEPSTFTGQGHLIADLLRMLLAIRKALPKTMCRESDGKLVAEDETQSIKTYFEALNLDFEYVQGKRLEAEYSPQNSRCFDLYFCSVLLLPGFE